MRIDEIHGKLAGSSKRIFPARVAKVVFKLAKYTAQLYATAKVAALTTLCNAAVLEQ